MTCIMAALVGACVAPTNVPFGDPDAVSDNDDDDDDDTGDDGSSSGLSGSGGNGSGSGGSGSSSSGSGGSGSSSSGNGGSGSSSSGSGGSGSSSSGNGGNGGGGGTGGSGGSSSSSSGSGGSGGDSSQCWIVDGNPSCDSLSLGVDLLTIENVQSGSYGFGQNHSLTLAVANDYFDFVSSGWIAAVIVKGGPNAMVCEYTPATLADVGLHAPTNPHTEIPYGISHISFCE